MNSSARMTSITLSAFTSVPTEIFTLEATTRIRFANTMPAAGSSSAPPPRRDALRDPLDFTFGPDGDLYVSGYESGGFESGSVFRFDGQTGEYIQTLGAEFGAIEPWGITFGPDGNLYIASFAGSVVGRLDGVTLQYIDDFTQTGQLSGAGSIAFGPDGNLYVASWYNSSVQRFDGNTGVFIDYFVSPNSGGLVGPKSILFTSVPEPSTLALAAVGMIALAARWAAGVRQAVAPCRKRHTH